MINPKLGDLSGKKFAIYLRKSAGEKGTTKKQLQRIDRDIAALEEATGMKIDRRIVGKDINKKVRFKASRDLAKEGDIFNEGEGATGFKIKNRQVWQHLYRLLEEGEYDGVAIETFDRLSRDIHGLAHFALPLWREDGKIILGFDGSYLDDDLSNEYLLGVTSNAASLTKAQEIEKSKKGRADAIDIGFVKAGRPEFIGSGTKNAGLSYRDAYNAMLEAGENRNGGLMNPTMVGAKFGKDNKWASLWYLKMKEYDRLGVLESWLASVEAFNQFIIDKGGYPSVKWKTDKEVANIKKYTAGYFAYPAGIKVEQTKEFVQFPSPMNFDFDILSDLDDPRDYPNNMFRVRRVKTIPSNLSTVQIQGRSRATRKS